MDIFDDLLWQAFIIGGMTSVALLWVVSAAGAFAVLGETFGPHLKALIERIRR